MIAEPSQDSTKTDIAPEASSSVKSEEPDGDMQIFSQEIAPSLVSVKEDQPEVAPTSAYHDEGASYLKPARVTPSRQPKTGKYIHNFTFALLRQAFKTPLAQYMYIYVLLRLIDVPL